MSDAWQAGTPNLDRVSRIVASLRPKLVVNGQAIRAEGIAELREGLSAKAASQRVGKDRLDELFFEAGGRHYVAYGQGLKVPARNSTVRYGALPARVLEVDNESNSAGEGAVTAVKLIGVKVGIKVGIVAGVAGLAMVGAGKLSQSVSGVLSKAKHLGHRFLQGAARRMGTSVPVAGVIIGGTVLAVQIGAGALISAERKPDYGPLRDITRP